MKRITVDQVYGDIYSLEIVDNGVRSYVHLDEAGIIALGLPVPCHEGRVFESNKPGTCVEVTQRERQKAKLLHSKINWRG